MLAVPKGSHIVGGNSSSYDLPSEVEDLNGANTWREVEGGSPGAAAEEGEAEKDLRLQNIINKLKKNADEAHIKEVIRNSQI